MDDDRMARVLAYVDGELDPERARAFEAEIAADPSLAQAVADHRGLAGRIGGAYAPVLEEPVPARLAMAASAANDRGLRRWAPWAAAAASLFVGVMAGRMAAPTHDLAAGPDGLVARGALAQALSSQLASDPGAVRVGLTFKDAAGRWCRTFQSGEDRLAGLACRQEGRWRVEVAATGAAQARAAYRQAASPIPPAVLAAVDALQADAPLDAAAERRARDGGWRR